MAARETRLERGLSLRRAPGAEVAPCRGPGGAPTRAAATPVFGVEPAQRAREGERAPSLSSISDSTVGVNSRISASGGRASILGVNWRAKIRSPGKSRLKTAMKRKAAMVLASRNLRFDGQPLEE